MPDARQQRPGGRSRDSELVFVALGGIGEIGMNAYLYGFGSTGARRWLMVDLGITFPEGENDPGVDVILPDLKFIAAERRALEGLVLTHAHEDHMGAVIELWEQIGAPIYATPFTAGMLRSKLAEFGGRLKLPITEVPLGGRFTAGPFDVELVSMAHSIPEPNALAIRTPAGTVLHTGDWKLDQHPLVGTPSDEARLKALGEEGVLALVCDSTNAMRDGRSPSELEVAQSLARIVKSAGRRVAITTFSSNVARIRAVGDAARAAGRRLVVAGRALHRVIQVAIETGYLPKGFDWLDQKEFSYLRPEEAVLLCTGSQGEPRAAMARIAAGEHPDISLAKGDLVIFSSRTIPGNEKEIGRIQNCFARMGCEVLTDNEALVHVTGHPRREELRQMYAWTRPRIAVPMHGEARHVMAHARLAREAGVPEVVAAFNGEMVRLAPEPVKVIDDVPVGRLFRDGNLLVSSVEGPVRERRKLGFVGIAVVAVALDGSGTLLAQPEVALDGVPQETEDGEAMADIVLDTVEATLKSIPAKRRRDPDLVRDALRRAVRAAIYDEWGKKPICKVMLNVVED